MSWPTATVKDIFWKILFLTWRITNVLGAVFLIIFKLWYKCHVTGDLCDSLDWWLVKCKCSIFSDRWCRAHIHAVVFLVNRQHTDVNAWNVKNILTDPLSPTFPRSFELPPRILLSLWQASKCCCLWIWHTLLGSCFRTIEKNGFQSTSAGWKIGFVTERKHHTETSPNVFSKKFNCRIYLQWMTSAMIKLLKRSKIF